MLISEWSWETSVHASVWGRDEDNCTTLLCAKEMYNYVQGMCKLRKALWSGGGEEGLYREHALVTQEEEEEEKELPKH